MSLPAGPTETKIELLYYFLGCVALLSWPARWLWKWLMRVDRAVTNEIPHLYWLVQKICRKLDIEVDDFDEPSR